MTASGKIRGNRKMLKAKINLLIYLADPQSRPVVIIVFAHVVRPSVPTFPNLAKQNKFLAKTMFTTGETVGLAEWIIDDSYLVFVWWRLEKMHFSQVSYIFYMAMKIILRICTLQFRTILIFPQDWPWKDICFAYRVLTWYLFKQFHCQKCTLSHISFCNA